MPGVVAVGPMALLLRTAGVPSFQQRATAPAQTGPVQLWRDIAGSAFLYTAANWDSATWYLEVYMRSTSAKALARVYDVTAAAEVAGSIVTDDNATDNLAAYVRSRSAALTLVDGHEYRVQFGAQDGGAGGTLSAQLIAI